MSRYGAVDAFELATVKAECGIMKWYHIMKSHSDTTAFTTRLSARLADEAKQLAEKRKVSLNRLVTQSLEKELAAERLKLAREGYAHYAASDASEAEEGMAEWSELVELDDGS